LLIRRATSFRLRTAIFQDATVAKAVHDVGPELARKVNDLPLPIVKGVGLEQSYAKLTESLQAFDAVAQILSIIVGREAVQLMGYAANISWIIAVTHESRKMLARSMFPANSYPRIATVTC
jgi:hypothetical protein